MLNFFEFFAGGGMVHAGLGASEWTCLFANDFDHKKAFSYTSNWGEGSFRLGDVGALTTEDLPGVPDMAWASFPCQDLSLAGAGAGLKGDRSGTFWPFWKLMQALAHQQRAPSIIALENVCGAITSHEGRDFAAICGALCSSGYRVGALVIDAALFVPQSRPRLFIIGVRDDVVVPSSLTSTGAVKAWHTRSLIAAQNAMPRSSRNKWIWWSLPMPPPRSISFSDVIEKNPDDVQWHSIEETQHILGMMSDANHSKVAEVQKNFKYRVGAIYKRTRKDESGQKIQRAEVRFDDLAGCLRTPSGGSSRQLIIVVEGKKIRTRLISGRETARLMGLPEDYKLPNRYNETYHLTGDGVVVPVVAYLAKNLFEPVLAGHKKLRRIAA